MHIVTVGAVPSGVCLIDRLVAQGYLYLERLVQMARVGQESGCEPVSVSQPNALMTSRELSRRVHLLFRGISSYVGVYYPLLPMTYYADSLLLALAEEAFPSSPWKTSLK